MLPFFVQTEPSKVYFKHLQCVISYSMTVLEDQKSCDRTKHDIDIHVFFFSGVHVYIQTCCSYNALWLRSWPTMHCRQWRSYVFYIITISKQRTLFGSHMWGWMLPMDVVFSGKFTKVSVGRALLLGADAFFSGRMQQRVSWMDRMTEALLRLQYCFSYRLPKTLPATTLPLWGPVT